MIERNPSAWKRGRIEMKAGDPMAASTTSAGNIYDLSDVSVTADPN
jgi:hypothetical protein